MEEFEEQSSPGGRERLQMKELEALQEEIISKLTVNTFLEQGTSVLPPSQPISTLNRGALPPGTLDAGWETPEEQYTSPGQQKRPDTAPQEALNRTGSAAELPGQGSGSTPSRFINSKQQVGLSPRSKSVLTPAHPAVATPNQYTSVGVVTTQSAVTTPIYPTVAPPTQPVPIHQTTLEESATRVNLVEKHAKHISDLKAYYEGEMMKLREQAPDLGQHLATSEQAWLQWRAAVGSSGGAVHSPAHTHSPSLFGSPVKTTLQFPRSPLKPGSVTAHERGCG